ncbi:MAG TPA: carboxypeptidase-like regulatory domain-containing protein [Gemmatimonadaceae bacterium]
MLASRLVAPLIVLLLPGAVSAQVLTGVVREDSTELPLVGVEVAVEGKKNQTTTDSTGRYAFVAPGGVQIILLRSPGFRPVRMRVTMKGDTVRADARLVRVSPTQLAPVLVNQATRLAGTGRDGFADRRKLGLGKFVDSTALRARDSRQVSDVLRELTGIKLMDWMEPGSSVYEVRAVSPLVPMSQSYRVQGPTGLVSVPGNPPCFVSVFFNGTTIYRSERGSQSGRPPDFTRDFSIASLEAIEYYRSASEVPPQFGGANANCGALVLWSRR